MGEHLPQLGFNPQASPESQNYSEQVSWFECKQDEALTGGVRIASVQGADYTPLLLITPNGVFAKDSRLHIRAIPIKYRLCRLVMHFRCRAEGGSTASESGFGRPFIAAVSKQP